jgi:aminoglycoside phosphotransferase (APT) family kinase protein
MANDEQLTRIAEGREAEIFAYGDGRVLRLFRPGEGRSVEHEIAAMRAVREVVPMVPEVFGTADVNGRAGIIMERIDGPDLLTRIASKPWTVWGAGSMLGSVHARLHDVVAPPGIASLVDRARMLGDLTTLVPRDALEWALPRFERMLDGDKLLHGDFHPANVLLSGSGPIVIDWPNVTRGNPDADLARSLLILRVGEVPPGSPFVVRYGERVARKFLAAAYLRAYRRHRPVDTAVVERWVSLRAVDRLGDGISEERAALLAMIESAMKSGV